MNVITLSENLRLNSSKHCVLSPTFKELGYSILRLEDHLVNAEIGRPALPILLLETHCVRLEIKRN
jgi:hypothetical protein